MTMTDTLTQTQAQRRRLLVTTSLVGGTGLVAITVPFIKSMNPSQRARSRGAPVRVNINRLIPGQQITVNWRGQPIWILRRTAQMITDLRSARLRDLLTDPDSTVETQQPSYTQNTLRAIKPEILVAVGICTHLGCVPTFRPEIAPEDLGTDWHGGYFCPCHGSRFDLAGRVYQGVPAPTNLVIPPHQYLSASEIEIGTDSVTSRT